MPAKAQQQPCDENGVLLLHNTTNTTANLDYKFVQGKYTFSKLPTIVNRYLTNFIKKIPVKFPALLIQFYNNSAMKFQAYRKSNR